MSIKFFNNFLNNNICWGDFPEMCTAQTLGQGFVVVDDDGEE